MKVKDYKELKVWQNGIDLVDGIYGVTDNFPSTEKYILAGHMIKTSISIPSNVAEGFARQHPKEYTQFLYIALGSCAELDTQLTMAHRRKYISQSRFDELADQINHESRMLSSLIKTLFNERRATNHERR